MTARPGADAPRARWVRAGLLTLSGRALGLLYIGGALSGIVAIGLPHGLHFNVLAAVVLSVLALGVGTWAWSRRELGPTATHVLLTVGVAMVSAGVYSGRGDDVSMSAAVLYVVLALGAGLFTSPRGVALQVALMAAAYGGVLAVSGNGGAFAEWLFVIGAGTVVAWVTAVNRSQLARLAQLDPLTGLSNRAGLDSELAREMSKSKRSGRSLIVAVVDLDDFKALNDRHGHLAGDHALVSLVAAWRLGLRGSDLLARFGGDEFVIVLPETSMWEATRVLRRLRHESACAWSAGVAAWDGTESLDRLLVRADGALYRAKGRARGSRVALGRPDPGLASPLRSTGLRSTGLRSTGLRSTGR